MMKRQKLISLPGEYTLAHMQVHGSRILKVVDEKLNQKDSGQNLILKSRLKIPPTSVKTSVQA